VTLLPGLEERLDIQSLIFKSEIIKISAQIRVHRFYALYHARLLLRAAFVLSGDRGPAVVMRIAVTGGGDDQPSSGDFSFEQAKSRLYGQFILQERTLPWKLVL